MVNLELLAKEVMREWGLQPEFPQEALRQVSDIKTPAPYPQKAADMRQLLWCSIDNDDSLDLDQLTYGENAQDGGKIVWIAVADVGALIAKNSPVDTHAKTNTTSVYTPAKIFPMLPEKLSTNLTSLNENQDRAAIVTKITLNAEGEIQSFSIFQAMVCNRAKLTYNEVGAWLEGTKSVPEKVAQVPGLEEVILCQHEAAQTLKERRSAMGSLTLAPAKVEAKVTDANEIILEVSPHNFAHQLIEEFMIAANYSLASQMIQERIPSLRRVVRVPLRWDKIVEVAQSLGESLPGQPDSKALDLFLRKRKTADPQSFPDLSLTVIKLLGSGEYVVENVGDAPLGHFGLALSNYTHATAPNRRFPDLISQRQYKAHLTGEPPPYSIKELYSLADHCTAQEDAAKKVERHLTKSAAAQLLSKAMGKVFKGIVTGASEKGTWVRIFDPPVEGKIVSGFQKLDVADRVAVRLVSVDIEKGYIDFERKL